MLIFNQERYSDDFHQVRGHRAIGVVCQPDLESYGNYVPTILQKRYDAFLYIDKTEALHPLHIEPWTVCSYANEMAAIGEG
jgi:erythromycin esterase